MQQAAAAEPGQFLIEQRARVVRVVEQAAERRLGCEAAATHGDTAHEHQLTRRHGREGRELRRGPATPPRGGAEQVLRVFRRRRVVVAVVAVTVFFCGCR